MFIPGKRARQLEATDGEEGAEREVAPVRALRSGAGLAGEGHRQPPSVSFLRRAGAADRFERRRFGPLPPVL